MSTRGRVALVTGAGQSVGRGVGRQRPPPGPVRRVRDFPADGERLTADPPVGIRHVLVNGWAIILDGEHDPHARPGQLVRPSRR